MCAGPRSTLPTVWWLRPRDESTVEAVSTSGAVSTARIDPWELVSATTDVAAPREARLELEGGPVLEVLAWRPPGEAGLLCFANGDGLEMADAILENLINQVAHDLRNVAFSIGLQAEMAARRDASPEVLGHFAAILRQIDALKGYLETLLLYGRPPRLSLRSTEMAPFLSAVVDQFTRDHEASAKAPTIGTSLAPDLGSVDLDPDKVERVLRILLDNAVRSADPAPTVTLAATATPAAVTIEVVDQGSGIPPELLPRLRQPMAVRRAGGTGLGIPIVAKIARAHGGRFELTSSGSGTTARLVLPREANAG